MSKIRDYFEAKAHIFMLVTVIAQTALFIAFTALYFTSVETISVQYNIHIIGSMFIFVCYMFHFSIHSVFYFLYFRCKELTS